MLRIEGYERRGRERKEGGVSIERNRGRGRDWKTDRGDGRNIQSVVLCFRVFCILCPVVKRSTLFWSLYVVKALGPENIEPRVKRVRRGKGHTTEGEKAETGKGPRLRIE